MVIRRIRGHVATHNWFAVGIDLAIVMLGVFLGIQASNWNESRIEAEEGRSYRARLIAELDFNTRQHRQQSAYYRQVLGHGLAALQSLRSDKIGDPSQFLIDAVQLTQVDTSPGKSYIYNEMISSGLVNRLGDEAVQQAASDYYIQVSENDRALLHGHPFRDIVRGIVPYSIQGDIQVNCGDRNVYHGKRIVGVRLPDPCPVRLDPSLAAESARQVRNEPGIERELTRYLGSIHEKLGSLDDTLNLASQLRTSLHRPAQGL